MISPSAAISRSPGTGIMTCCERGHAKMGDDGVSRTIPCRKNEFAPVMLRMLKSRREFLLGSGDLVNYRMWTALTPSVMQGLTSNDMPALPSSVEEFISVYRLKSARDEENHGSGLCPVLLSALSGNIVVLNELISQHSVNINARLQMNLYEYGVEQGATALTVSAGMCPQDNARAVIGALLTAGADPNVQTMQGTTPLMAAAAYQNLKAVRALLACGGSALDLEKSLKANHATALSIAAFTGTTEIVEALVQAGANRKHIEDGGGSKLSDACSNPAADIHMLEVLCRGDHSLRSNINDQMKPRTAKFKMMDIAAQTALRVQGRATSLLVTGRAHCEGSTALHFSARSGNAKLIRWLLENGADPSLSIKNKMGCLPIDIARIFGPHTEVEGLLAAAMMKTMQRRFMRRKSKIGLSEPTVKLTRKALVKRLETTTLQTARSGETAIEMLYPMWLMPAHEFMTLSELRPHQELVAAGKLVKWNAAMESVFFLSHQWTSFDRPDHSTKQLHTVQKALVRMLCGKLPTTAPQFADAIRLPSKVQISPADWKAIVPHTYVWMDFISVRSLSLALWLRAKHSSPEDHSLNSLSVCSRCRYRKATRPIQN